jgi:energy-coupling factor transporter ATP-binding protein EcfA2
LKANCLINVKRYAEDAIQSIFNALAEKGYVEKQLAVETDGFYIDENGKLQCSRLIPMDEKELKEGVKRGIRKLNEVAIFFDQNAFGAMIKASILLPLTYVLKKTQSGSEAPRRIYTIGPPGCGKTTLALITNCYIWGTEIERFFRPFKDISTEARLGKVMSQWTFPTLIDNASDLFADEKYSPMRSVMNSAEESEFVRRVHVKGRYTSIPALSPLIFTIDSAVAEKLNAADKRRAVIIRLGIEHLTQKDASEKVREFNRRYGARGERLGREGDLMYIGQWLMRYYIENWEKIRNKSWLEVVDEVLNALFEYAGEPKPVWLEAKVGDKEEILETVYEEMKEKVIDVINDYIINIIIEKGKRSELETRPGFWDRLNYITNLKVRAGIYALDDGKKYGLPWNRTVVITRKIIEVFLKEQIQLTNLKDLANLMDWEYREAFVCRPLGIVKQPAVFAPVETFEEAETDKVDAEEITLDLTP